MARMLPNDIKVARIFLSDWGIWHKREHSLPPSARLATPPSEGVFGSEESLEVSHRAVLMVRDASFDQYLAIRELYENQHESPGDVFDKIKGRLRIDTFSGFRKLRSRAERAFLKARIAEVDRLEAQYLDNDNIFTTTY